MSRQRSGSGKKSQIAVTALKGRGKIAGVKLVNAGGATFNGPNAAASVLSVAGLRSGDWPVSRRVCTKNRVRQ